MDRPNKGFTSAENVELQTNMQCPSLTPTTVEFPILNDDVVTPIISVVTVTILGGSSSCAGYTVTQENGQRRIGPPADWPSEPPARGCEVFVGKLPRDCDEHELVPVFERVGQIYELRLMMDFNGTNRGYCFVTFARRDDARKAVRELNNYEV